MATKKTHKEQELKATYEHEPSEDAEARLQRIFEFLLSDEIGGEKRARCS